MEEDREYRSLEDIYREEREREGPVVIPPQIDSDYLTFLEGHGRIEDIGTLLGEFEKYKRLARQNPGEIVEGNPLLGAPLQYYSPSEEEKRLSEIGRTIKGVLGSCKDLKSCLRLVKYMVDNGIYEDVITYDLYFFSHVDVVGSGRFVYPEGPFQGSFSIIDTLLECLANSAEAAIPEEELQRLKDMKLGDKQDIRNCLQGILKLCGE